jgi:hypothetical protein
MPYVTGPVDLRIERDRLGGPVSGFEQHEAYRDRVSAENGELGAVFIGFYTERKREARERQPLSIHHSFPEGPRRSADAASIERSMGEFSGLLDSRVYAAPLFRGFFSLSRLSVVISSLARDYSASSSLLNVPNTSGKSYSFKSDCVRPRTLPVYRLEVACSRWNDAS